MIFFIRKSANVVNRIRILITIDRKLHFFKALRFTYKHEENSVSSSVTLYFFKPMVWSLPDRET